MSVIADLIATPTGSSVLEVDLIFEDNTGGKATRTFGLVWNTDAATTLADLNAAVNAIEAILPLHVLREVRFCQVARLASGDAIAVEAQIEERLKMTFDFTAPTSAQSVIIPAVKKTTSSGAMVSNGNLDATNTEYIAVKTLFDPAGAEVLRPIIKGTAATATKWLKSKYQPSPGAKGRFANPYGV